MMTPTVSTGLKSKPKLRQNTNYRTARNRNRISSQCSFRGGADNDINANVDETGLKGLKKKAGEWSSTTRETFSGAEK